ncbi:small ribosomal subunit Rsm22 family protein [Halomicrococcus gelatinilyticus]|uniref:small ribosomal subunit Rsm22 family protein n=1 Tax=Halomicrococcus gelatinilyticus TaxID=1702103 RepID=UPI002E1668A0
MNADQREGVVSNAKYLRSVRPVDPEEVSEYVEGQPHPAAVRQVLREEAVDLGLVERDDGTFEPASEEPVPHEFRGVERFPERYGRCLEDLLVESLGVGWPDAETGEQLRTTIRRLKEDYFAQNPVEYDRDVALGYAVYHLPDYYAVVQYVLSELTERGLLSGRLRVLDVGAGVGGPAIGLHDLLPEDALVDYHAVEPGESADVLAEMLSETGRNFHPTVHRDMAEAFDPEGTYDLVLFANVLSELDDPEAVTRKYLDVVADDGSLVAIAPADRNASIGLREVERSVTDRATVFSPTLRLWPGEEPSDDCWSFDVKPDVEVPPFQRRLDEAGEGDGEFVNADVQYSYSILRRDDTRRLDLTADAGRFAKMAEMERHVTRRVDLLAVKLSHSLSESDADNQVYRVGDGSQQEDHFAVLAKETALNAALADAGYGEPLVFEEVLVLWNDDEAAYNLVVDEKTIVDRL